MGSRNRYSRSVSRSYSASRSPRGRGYASRSPRRSRSRGRRYRSPPRARGGAGGGYRGDSPSFRSRSPRYERRGPPIHENQDRQVYVARFSRRTSEYELRRAFEKYGPVEKIDLKEGRGFGFIVSDQISEESPKTLFFVILFLINFSTIGIGAMPKTPSTA